MNLSQMNRCTIICLSLLSSIYAAPVDETALNSFISNDMTAELSSLLNAFEKFEPSDLAYLKGIIVNRNEYKSEHEILQKMQKEKPELYEKVIKLLKPYYTKMRNLNEEAQQFFLNISEVMIPTVTANSEPSIEQMMSVGFKVSARYTALSEEAKASIAKEFPVIAKGFALIADLEKTMSKMFEM